MSEKLNPQLSQNSNPHIETIDAGSDSKMESVYKCLHQSTTKNLNAIAKLQKLKELNLRTKYQLIELAPPVLQTLVSAAAELKDDTQNLDSASKNSTETRKRKEKLNAEEIRKTYNDTLKELQQVELASLEADSNYLMAEIEIKKMTLPQLQEEDVEIEKNLETLSERFKQKKTVFEKRQKELEELEAQFRRQSQMYESSGSEECCLKSIITQQEGLNELKRLKKKLLDEECQLKENVKNIEKAVQDLKAKKTQESETLEEQKKKLAEIAEAEKAECERLQQETNRLKTNKKELQKNVEAERNDLSKIRETIQTQIEQKTQLESELSIINKELNEKLRQKESVLQLGTLNTEVSKDCHSMTDKIIPNDSYQSSHHEDYDKSPPSSCTTVDNSESKESLVLSEFKKFNMSLQSEEESATSLEHLVSKYPTPMKEFEQSITDINAPGSKSENDHMALQAQLNKTPLLRDPQINASKDKMTEQEKTSQTIYTSNVYAQSERQNLPIGTPAFRETTLQKDTKDKQLSPTKSKIDSPTDPEQFLTTIDVLTGQTETNLEPSYTTEQMKSHVSMTSPNFSLELPHSSGVSSEESSGQEISLFQDQARSNVPDNLDPHISHATASSLSKVPASLEDPDKKIDIVLKPDDLVLVDSAPTMYSSQDLKKNGKLNSRFKQKKQSVLHESPNTRTNLSEEQSPQDKQGVSQSQSEFSSRYHPDQKGQIANLTGRKRLPNSMKTLQSDFKQKHDIAKNLTRKLHETQNKIEKLEMENRNHNNTLKASQDINRINRILANEALKEAAEIHSRQMAQMNKMEEINKDYMHRIKSEHCRLQVYTQLYDQVDLDFKKLIQRIDWFRPHYASFEKMFNEIGGIFSTIQNHLQTSVLNPDSTVSAEKTKAFLDCVDTYLANLNSLELEHSKSLETSGRLLSEETKPESDSTSQRPQATAMTEEDSLEEAKAGLQYMLRNQKRFLLILQNYDQFMTLADQMSNEFTTILNKSKLDLDEACKVTQIEIQELQDKSKSLQATHSGLFEEQETLQLKVQNATSQIEEMKAKLENVDVKKKTINESMDEQQSNLKVLQDSLDQAKLELKTKQEELDKINVESGSTDEKIKAQKTFINLKEKEHEDLQSHLKDIQKKIDQVREEMLNFDESMKICEENKNVSLSKLNNLKGRFQDISDQHASYVGLIQALAPRIETLKKQVQDVEAFKKQLTNQLGNLKSFKADFKFETLSNVSVSTAESDSQVVAESDNVIPNSDSDDNPLKLYESILSQTQHVVVSSHQLVAHHLAAEIAALRKSGQSAGCFFDHKDCVEKLPMIDTKPFTSQQIVMPLFRAMTHLLSFVDKDMSKSGPITSPEKIAWTDLLDLVDKLKFYSSTKLDITSKAYILTPCINYLTFLVNPLLETVFGGLKTKLLLKSTLQHLEEESLEIQGQLKQLLTTSNSDQSSLTEIVSLFRVLEQFDFQKTKLLHQQSVEASVFLAQMQPLYFQLDQLKKSAHQINAELLMETNGECKEEMISSSSFHESVHSADDDVILEEAQQIIQALEAIRKKIPTWRKSESRNSTLFGISPRSMSDSKPDESINNPINLNATLVSPLISESISDIPCDQENYTLDTISRAHRIFLLQENYTTPMTIPTNRESGDEEGLSSLVVSEEECIPEKPADQLFFFIQRIKAQVEALQQSLQKKTKRLVPLHFIGDDHSALRPQTTSQSNLFEHAGLKLKEQDRSGYLSTQRTNTHSPRIFKTACSSRLLPNPQLVCYEDTYEAKQNMSEMNPETFTLQSDMSKLNSPSAALHHEVDKSHLCSSMNAPSFTSHSSHDRPGLPSLNLWSTNQSDKNSNNRNNRLNLKIARSVSGNSDKSDSAQSFAWSTISTARRNAVRNSPHYAKPVVLNPLIYHLGIFKNLLCLQKGCGRHQH